MRTKRTERGSNADQKTAFGPQTLAFGLQILAFDPQILGVCSRRAGGDGSSHSSKKFQQETRSKARFVARTRIHPQPSLDVMSVQTTHEG